LNNTFKVNTLYDDGSPAVNLTYQSDWLYNRFTFGVVAMVGFYRQLGERWGLRAGLRTEFDLSNADNLDAEFDASYGFEYPRRWSTGLRANAVGGPPNFVAGRSKSHNLRVGLDFSVLYSLE
jgi:hypothetical protein